MVLWDDVRALVDDAHRIAYLSSNGEMKADVPPSFSHHPTRSGPPFQPDSLVQGNVLDVLSEMPTQSVQCVVTSPPYWGVRVYADEQVTQWPDGQAVSFGHERWPEDYVRHSLFILRMLRRVVKEDGVVWWNVGDTYMTRSHVRPGSGERLDALEGRRRKESWRDYPVRRYSAGHPYLKDKDLTLIPFQVALGAQRLGWWVRAVIVWSKDNTLPEPAKDRPTTSHEYILMLSQTRFYKYRMEQSREEAVSEWTMADLAPGLRHPRTVWSFPTSSGGGHVAAFPIELPTRCILAATDVEDLVFDPFAGAGTTLVAAKRLGRRYFGCDISPTYVAEAERAVAASVEPTRTL
jgi:DNA modification methylase